MNERTNERTNERMNGWMDGWMGGWMNFIYVSQVSSKGNTPANI